MHEYIAMETAIVNVYILLSIALDYESARKIAHLVLTSTEASDNVAWPYVARRVEWQTAVT